MIFYFSATGNSKYVAERIAKELNTNTENIVECIESQKFDFHFIEHESVGIVAPTYFWGVPKNVKEYLKKVKLRGNSYFFYVSTCGIITGASGKMADNYLKQHGNKLDAMFSIRMPDTWTPILDLSNKQKVEKTNKKAEKELMEVICKIKEQIKGNYMKYKTPMFAAKANYSTYGIQARTSRFTVEDTCIGCGLCAKKCPAKAIEMKNGMPIWVKDQCIICLGCLHRCPEFAIQYGKHTKGHGQYLNPYTNI